MFPLMLSESAQLTPIASNATTMSFAMRLSFVFSQSVLTVGIIENWYSMKNITMLIMII